MSPEAEKPITARRTVCDHCRRRRKHISYSTSLLLLQPYLVALDNWTQSIANGNLGIRCDGKFPCNQCESASLSCKREHVPKRRGPKRGSGRVINELRALNAEGREKSATKENGSKSTISDGSHSLRSPS
jgi:hypothetical protein